MKKIIRILGVLLVSAFMLLPLKTNAQEPEWSQKLELGDSVSSAIAKVEDGVVVMQYEGTASASNLLIKYDFNGKKIWEIDNDYGYNIESVSDGFIVWSETKITKFDKDKNILWSKDIELSYTIGDSSPRLAGLGNNLIEIDNSYIICQTQSIDNPHNDFFRISFDGNIMTRLSSKTLFDNNNIDIGTNYNILATNISSDNNTFILVYTQSGGSVLYIKHVTSDFIINDSYVYDISTIKSSSYLHANGNTSVIQSNDGYILIGKEMLKFFNNGKFKKYNRTILGIEELRTNIYAYEIRENEDNYVGIYDFYLVKYNSNLEELSKIKLPLSVIGDKLTNISYYSTGFSQIKNRSVLYESNNNVNVISLNTPVVLYRRTTSDNNNPTIVRTYDIAYEIQSGKYELASYRFADDVSPSDKINNNPSGIISNIIKNPQTNSIIIIVSVVVLILVISIISYLLYMKKTKKNLIK